ncbi:MAG: hypothetical protein AAFX86_01765 [Pseudomonadota bacterium]
MSDKKKLGKSDKPKSPKHEDSFEEVARKSGADLTGEAFEKAFKRIVPSKTK